MPHSAEQRLQAVREVFAVAERLATQDIRLNAISVLTGGFAAWTIAVSSGPQMEESQTNFVAWSERKSRRRSVAEEASRSSSPGPWPLSAAVYSASWDAHYELLRIRSIRRSPETRPDDWKEELAERASSCPEALRIAEEFLSRRLGPTG